MNKIDSLRGVFSKVQISKKGSLFLLLALLTALLAACGETGTGPNGPDLSATAATVNGKAITMEEVERAFKQQAQGQEGRLSPLEVAAARLQVLQSLIEQEVMYQKAEKEGALPTDEEVNAEYNKRRTASSLSEEQWNAKMKEVGETEASAKTAIKKGLAIQKLTDKITGKIENPKDAEVEAFYNGNKAAFVRKKGVKLAAIVIDPANNGEGDTTTDEVSAVAKANEIIGQLRNGADFATIAREKSEDQSRFQGGDLGYISEEEMRQTMPAQTVQALMSPQSQIGAVVNTSMNGKFYILKLQERSDKDEELTLESTGVRQQVTESLNNARKQLLAASYQTIAMNEARIVNNLAQRVVENPNELSGARPAQPANANTNVATPSTTNANTNTNANSVPSNSNAVNANRPAANTANANANR
jgi:parvulin-like peptidyl-prolyl isomerase